MISVIEIQFLTWNELRKKVNIIKVMSANN